MGRRRCIACQDGDGRRCAGPLGKRALPQRLCLCDRHVAQVRAALAATLMPFFERQALARGKWKYESEVAR
jgi:hypothetical protein